MVLYTDEDFEMIAFEVKVIKKPKISWRMLGVYRAPNVYMRILEGLAARTGFTGNSTKRSIIGVTKTYPTQNGIETRVEILEVKHL